MARLGLLLLLPPGIVGVVVLALTGSFPGAGGPLVFSTLGVPGPGSTPGWRGVPLGEPPPLGLGILVGPGIWGERINMVNKKVFWMYYLGK